MEKKEIYRFVVFIRNSGGYPMPVYEYAENNFQAYEIARAKYGANLISENASRADN